MLKGFVLAIAVATLAFGSAQAATITYQMTGTGNYTLDDVTYEGAFTVTAVTDTDGITPYALGYKVGALYDGPTTPMTIEITLAGLGDFSVLDPTYAFQGSAPPTVPPVFGFGSLPRGDFVRFVGSSVLGYDLASDFGPVNGSGGYGSVSGQYVNTSGGLLIFNSVGDSTFQATLAPAPEPATWAMLLIGFGGAGALLRRRRTLAPA